MKKITPFLWFNDQAEEAAKFYVKLFKNSKITKVQKNNGRMPGPKVFSIQFTLDGQDFFALNGGPHYQINPGVSFYVNCATQKEVDDLWKKLSPGAKEMNCGWITDRFGLTWQIVPAGLQELLFHKDPAKAQAAMDAMMPMKKLDLAAMREAAGLGKKPARRANARRAGAATTVRARSA